MANNNIGPKRLVVGAHYGLKDWLAQRVTAIVMAVFTVVTLLLFLGASDFSYEGWAGLFAQQWFKILAFVTFLSLYYHAWVGMRDIWMDYVKPVWLRLSLQVLTVLALIWWAVWSIELLWRI